MQARGTIAGKQRGFTLIEVVTTLAVLGIVLGLGIPAMRALVLPSVMQSWTGTYHGALHLMRQQAVTTNEAISLCVLDATGSCTGQWGPHLSLFFDPRREGRLAQAADRVAEIRLPETDAVDVRWSGFGERRFLHVRANGSYRQNGRFTFCHRDGAAAGDGRQIVLNVTGRTRIERVACGGK